MAHSAFVVTNLSFISLIVCLIGLIRGSELTEIILKICTQQEDGKEDFIPLITKPIQEMSVSRNNVKEDVQVEPCVNNDLMKISFGVHPGFDGPVTMCLLHYTGTSFATSPTCYSINGLQAAETNATVSCWFKKNPTVTTVVQFYIIYANQPGGRDRPITHYTSVKLHTRGMCEESVCEQVEPTYGSMFDCGNTGLMVLPGRASVAHILVTCTTCHTVQDYTVQVQLNETDPSRIEMQFDDMLQTGTYNLTVWLKITNTFGENTLCPYRKVVTILCGGHTDVAGAGTVTEQTGRSVGARSHCEINPDQCSFVTFVLFGLVVSSVFVVLICIATLIFVKRKTFTRNLRSFFCGIQADTTTGQQQIPMLLNNGRTAAHSTSHVPSHFPKHAHFHKMDERFNLIFLPRPYDPFTRDCMVCIRKVLSLDGRISSACVFDRSIYTQINNNRYDWIESTLNDPHNVLVFLFFTSMTKDHEPSIIDEVMRSCQTAQKCHLVLAHMTESTDQLNEAKFSGSSYNITSSYGYGQFLKAVFDIYGYKSEDEFDRGKFGQILKCGASQQFLLFLNQCPSHSMEQL